MRKSLLRSLALAAAIPAGIILAAAAALLIAGYFRELAREPAAAAALEALEKASRQDDSKVPALAAELERQTQAALRRAAQQKTLGLILACSAAVFLLCLKGRPAGRPPPAPTLEQLRQARLVEARARARGNPCGSAARALGDRKAGARPAESLDLSAVEEIVARLGRGKDAAIPILQAIQVRYRYLPLEALRRACELTDLTPAQVAGVSTFYARFRRAPVGRHLLLVCHGTACHVSRAPEIDGAIRRYLKLPPGADTDAARFFTIERVACLGCCSLAPVIRIDEETFGKLTLSDAWKVIDAYRDGNDTSSTR